jgi:protein deglycase
MISITGDINVKSAQGVIVQADELLDEYVFEGDELLFLPGGPGHKSYYDCKDLLELLKEYNKKNNRIAAICAAPSILGNLGLLEGKKAMAFPGFEMQLTGAVIITAPERVVTAAIIISLLLKIFCLFFFINCDFLFLLRRIASSS